MRVVKLVGTRRPIKASVKRIESKIHRVYKLKSYDRILIQIISKKQIN